MINFGWEVGRGGVLLKQKRGSGVWIGHAILNKLVKVDLTKKVIVEQIPVGGKRAGCLRKSIPGRRKQM